MAITTRSTSGSGVTNKNAVLVPAEIDNNFISIAAGTNTAYGVSAQALHRSPNAISAMFIYDVSKDSDGGAWTEKCQNTSWYNETLSGNWLGAFATEAAARASSGATIGDYFQLTTTGAFYKLNALSGVSEVFRGNKAKFPKLVGIVIEVTSITLYDLTEPNRPMWMRFIRNAIQATTDSRTLFLSSSAVPVCVSALSGRVMIGVARATAEAPYYGGVINIDFAKDIAEQDHAGSVQWQLVAQRNDPVSKAAARTPWTTYASVVDIYAIDMIVLPNAPIDPVTGLAVPTIALASGVGVRVIRNNGTLVTLTNSSPTGVATIVKFLENNNLFYASDVSGASYTSYFHVNAIPSIDTNYGAYFSGANELEFYSGRSFGGGGPALRLGKADTYMKRIAFASTSSGLLLLDNNTPAVYGLKRKPSGKTGGTTLSITDTYNTGYMLGDIRRAYLADSVAESISDSEYLSGDSSNFVGGLGNWVISGSTLTWDSVNKYMVVSTGVGGYYGYARLPISSLSLTINKDYVVIFTIASLSNTTGAYGVANITTSNSDSSAYGSITGGYTGAGVYYLKFTYKGGSFPQIRIYPGNQNASISISSVLIRDAVLDRSYKEAGTNIYGTLTKSLSAANNQIVAYSGFSANNYLQEPTYSSDLDFGTGEFSISNWINVPTSALSSDYPTYGSDLLAGAGAFTDPTGWSGLSANCTISGGSLTKTGTVTHYVDYPLPALTQGDVLLVKFDVTAVNPNIIVRIGHAPGWNQSEIVVNTTGTQYRIFTAFHVGNNNEIGFDFGGGVTGTIQNLTVYKVKPSTIVSRKYSSGAYFEMVCLGANYIRAIAYDGTTTRTVTYPSFTGTQTNPTIAKNVWQKIEASYTIDGTLAIRNNGTVGSNTAGLPLLSLSNTSAVLTIGNSYELDAPFPASLSLLKLSATSPTSEQSIFMYEQEKYLFSNGANCLLPDSGNLVDLSYDNLTNEWYTVSANNESSWTDLVRTSVTPVPSGSNILIKTGNGIKLNARSTANAGVYITIPDINITEESFRKNEAGVSIPNPESIINFDTIAFNANTTSGSSNLTNVSVTFGTPYYGMGITGTGIGANATITYLGTNFYRVSNNSTATSSAVVTVNQSTYTSNVGFTAVKVVSGGVSKREGSTKDFTRSFDGFKETITFNTAPAANTRVQIHSISLKNDAWHK